MESAGDKHLASSHTMFCLLDSVTMSLESTDKYSASGLYTYIWYTITVVLLNNSGENLEKMINDLHTDKLRWV